MHGNRHRVYIRDRPLARLRAQEPWLAARRYLEQSRDAPLVRRISQTMPSVRVARP